MLNVKAGQRELRREDIDPTQSILSQRRDPETYPELTRLGDLLGKILIYRNWNFGPDAPIRASCRADVRSDVLSESLDNLPCRLAVLKRDPAVKRRLLAHLADLAPGFDDLEVVPEGGRLQLYVMESSRSFPALRLSDGTLRFLALLAILLDPTPAPLIVLEEPELGLHFDMMPTIAKLLVEASEKTQLVVTTHSDVLIDALSDTPESVVVCEKDASGSHLRRVAAEDVASPEGSPESEPTRTPALGAAWTRGELGGTRW